MVLFALLMGFCVILWCWQNFVLSGFEIRTYEKNSNKNNWKFCTIQRDIHQENVYTQTTLARMHAHTP